MAYVYMNQVMIIVQFLLSLVMFKVVSDELKVWSNELNHDELWKLNPNLLVSFVVILEWKMNLKLWVILFNPFMLILYEFKCKFKWGISEGYENYAWFKWCLSISLSCVCFRFKNKSWKITKWKLWIMAIKSNVEGHLMVW